MHRIRQITPGILLGPLS